MIPRAVARFYIGRLLACTKPVRADKRRRSRSAERERGFWLPVHFYKLSYRTDHLIVQVQPAYSKLQACPQSPARR